MKARVLFFARLSAIAGMRETEVELGEGMTARDVFDRLSEQFPEMADFGDSLMFAVNQRFVEPEQALRDGDELALIPPVSGGSRAIGERRSAIGGMGAPERRACCLR